MNCSSLSVVFIVLWTITIHHVPALWILCSRNKTYQIYFAVFYDLSVFCVQQQELSVLVSGGSIIKMTIESNGLETMELQWSITQILLCSCITLSFSILSIFQCNIVEEKLMFLPKRWEDWCSYKLHKFPIFTKKKWLERELVWLKLCLMYTFSGVMAQGDWHHGVELNELSLKKVSSDTASLLA